MKIGSEITCPICGKVFIKRLSAEKYCSMECSMKARKLRIQKNYNNQKKKPDNTIFYEKDCIVCAKPFVSSRKNASCCSNECRYELQKIKAREYNRKKQAGAMVKHEESVCKECGKMFTKMFSHQVFCCPACYSAYWKKHKKTYSPHPKPKPPKKKKSLSLEEIQKLMEAEGYPPYAYGKFIAEHPEIK